MRLNQIDDLIESFGLPHAYYAFDRDTAVSPPYIVYYSPGRDDLMADNYNFAQIMELYIELYTATKRWDLENAVEQRLTAAGLAYDKSEAKIDTDGLYQITYYMEVVINE